MVIGLFLLVAISAANLNSISDASPAEGSIQETGNIDVDAELKANIFTRKKRSPEYVRPYGGFGGGIPRPPGVGGRVGGVASRPPGVDGGFGGVAPRPPGVDGGFVGGIPRPPGVDGGYGGGGTIPGVAAEGNLAGQVAGGSARLDGGFVLGDRKCTCGGVPVIFNGAHWSIDPGFNGGWQSGGGGGGQGSGGIGGGSIGGGGGIGGGGSIGGGGGIGGVGNGGGGGLLY